MPVSEQVTQRELRIDRVACSGHGVCASLLPQRVRLDEWGYPILAGPHPSDHDGERAIRWCPARALYWAPTPGSAGKQRGK